MAKSKRTKACEIPPAVKSRVEQRDSIDGCPCCIFCGKPYPAARGEAHFIPRSQAGLGIEENLVTACRECHERMDNTIFREHYLKIARDHLMKFYPDWNEKKLVYKKGMEYK